MIPWEIFGMFLVMDLVFLYAAFLHENLGFWESPIFSGLATILSFMLALWTFSGLGVGNVTWTNGYAGMFFAMIALICIINLFVRVIDGFGKNIDVSEMLKEMD